MQQPGIGRVIVGFVAAPIAGAIALYLVVAAYLILASPRPVSSSLVPVALMVSTVGLYLGSWGALLGGVPAYLILCYFNWIRWYQFMIAGVAVAVLSLSVFMIQNGVLIDQIVSGSFWGFALLASLMGAVGGATFWLLVYRLGASATDHSIVVNSSDELDKTVTKDTTATRD